MRIALFRNRSESKESSSLKARGRLPSFEKSSVHEPNFYDAQPSARTGGYEGPTVVEFDDDDEDTDVDDNDTIQEHSLYTEGATTEQQRLNPPHSLRHVETNSGSLRTVLSNATTVWAGPVPKHKNPSHQRGAKPKTEFMTTIPYQLANKDGHGPIWAPANEDSSRAGRISLVSPDSGFGLDSSSEQFRIVDVVERRQGLGSIQERPDGGSQLRTPISPDANRWRAGSDVTEDDYERLATQRPPRRPDSDSIVDVDIKPSRQQQRDEKPKELETPISYRFEFGDTDIVTPKTKNRQRTSSGSSSTMDDEEQVQGSIYSFSFSQDDEGTGFEIDGYQSGRANGEVVSHSNSSVSSSLDLESNGNMSDRDLMERGSPGTLRLTEEGLSRHEKKSFREALKSLPNDPFEAWKLDNNMRKWHRQGHVDPGARRRKNADADPHREWPPQPHTPQEKPKRSGSNLPLFLSFQKDAAEDGSHPSLSVAATAATTATTSASPNQSSSNSQAYPYPLARANSHESCRHKILGQIFRNRRERTASSALLERDRELARFSSREDPRGKERIEMPRQAFFEQQRTTEMESPPIKGRHRRVISGSSFSSTSSPSHTNRRTSEHATGTGSTNSLGSAAGATVPPCVVCHRAERTHIATPCMHFSFCASCAIRLREEDPCGECPVCGEQNVTYSAVSI